MCAYNAVFGTAACANPRLLQDILRKDWGFTGFVTSDCGAIDDITAGHHNTGTNAEGAALAVKAGTDTGCDFKDEMLDGSDEHTSELQSLMRISYAVFCFHKKKIRIPVQ